jgi:hypothetical protein
MGSGLNRKTRRGGGTNQSMFKRVFLPSRQDLSKAGDNDGLML